MHIPARGGRRWHTSRLAFSSTLLLTLLLLTEQQTATTAHSILGYPKPYTTKSCRGCSACRRIKNPDHKRRNSKRRPAAVWRRGQKVTIRWYKNNHEGGFVRLSILPWRKKFSGKAHHKFAIYYGCWEQGLHACGRKSCGSDRRKRAFSRKIIVPRVIPNGVYIFSYMWYGGMSESRRTGRYGDYTSCSYVRIRGGRRTKYYRPFFRAGDTGRFATKPPGKCHTSASRPRVCSRGCRRKKPTVGIPSFFRGGKKLKLLRPGHYKK